MEPSNETPAIALDVRDLRMRYGTKDVLAGVTFTAKRGEVLALLGPNGAGKTTTIEILEGFRMRSAGHVSVLGTDPARGNEAWRARIGVVLQSWRDHKFWRVRELLAYQARFYAPFATAEVARPWDVDELIDVVGLSKSANAKIMTLSGGQRRRLDVAIGIVGRPEIVFFDEPTAGFDPHARRDFHDLIHRLSDFENTTILMTTHDLDEAEKIADRILVLDEGRIVADGSADQLARELTTAAEVHWTSGGRRHVHAAREGDPSDFVRDLLIKNPDVTELEVRRASLEDTYMALVRRVESGQSRGGGGPTRPPRKNPRCRHDHHDRTRHPLGRRSGRPLPRVDRDSSEPHRDCLRNRSRDPPGGVCRRAAVHAWDPRGKPCPARTSPLVTMVLPSLLGMTIVFGGLSGPAPSITADREDGTLLRAKATPNGMLGYLVGKIVMFALTTLLSLIAIVIPGIMIVDDLVLDARAWLLLALLFVVGMVSTVPIGVALGSLMKSSLQAMLVPLVCTLIMIPSGIFFPITVLPTWLQWVAQAFPFYWLGLGARSAMLPAEMVAAEIGQSWRTVEMFAVLGVWAVIGFLLAPILLRRMARRQSGSAVAKVRERYMTKGY